MFMHKNWSKKTDIIAKWKEQTEKRSLKDLSIGPVFTWNNEEIENHLNEVMNLEGAELLMGGKPLKNHTIPKCYGSWEPTLVKVPFKHLRGLKKRNLICTELFGPFSIVVEYKDSDVDTLLEHINNFDCHLTAAVVSNDPLFQHRILGKTLNGTQYTGLRARTTGAPQNHWFGPSGDPRGAGIGTPYAIQTTWSHHREIVTDIGPIKEDWTMPKPA